jgi:L-amino acid N-acyltransferase YncA
MRLLADLIARCQALGKRQMIAVIGGSQSAGSIGLHNRMGMKLRGLFHRRASSLATGRIQCS